MFQTARKAMPALDYVSIVRSIFDERRTMALGAFSSAVIALAAAWHAHAPILAAIGLSFLVIGVLRDRHLRGFELEKIGPTDVDRAAYWETQATIWAAAIALLHGLWCFVSSVLIQDPFAELSAISVSTAVMVGVASRNFGIDRLVAVQSLLIGLPLVLGLALHGDLVHILLACTFLPFFIGARTIAGRVRGMLLNALHDRQAATRLAEQLDAALATMYHGVFMIEAGGRVSVINERAMELIGIAQSSEAEGRGFVDLLDEAVTDGRLPEEATARLKALVVRNEDGKQVIQTRPEKFCEVTLSSRQGRRVLLVEDVTERMKAQDRINYMARFDQLTGLANRAHFAERVTKRLGHLGAGEQAGLLILDLDDFKLINDTLGHLVGDRLLAEVATRLKSALGSQYDIGRFGGDEFIIFRSGQISPSAQAGAAEAVLRVFADPFEVFGQELHINASVGHVIAEGRDLDLDVMISRADLALYKAKGEGRHCARAFRPEMDIDHRYRQRLKQDLRACVEREGLTLFYQPLVDIKTRRVVACEALARWHHADLGPISPSVFIPLAEEAGLITDISRWVLRQATHECMRWPETVSVSVNISALDFRQGDVENMVQSALTLSGLKANRLELEVTEGVLLSERATAKQVLKKLGSTGVRLALDDFGTGYSNLSYLNDLPVTKLKIDRSFVNDVSRNPRSLRLLNNVARLGKDMGLVVTAEGVETTEQLDLLVETGNVDQIQGFLFGAPLPRNEIANLIAAMDNPKTRAKLDGKSATAPSQSTPTRRISRIKAG